MAKTFKVEVTQLVEVELDESKFTPEFMAEFRETFYQFKTTSNSRVGLRMPRLGICVAHRPADEDFQQPRGASNATTSRCTRLPETTLLPTAAWGFECHDLVANDAPAIRDDLPTAAWGFEYCDSPRMWTRSFLGGDLNSRAGLPMLRRNRTPGAPRIPSISTAA